MIAEWSEGIGMLSSVFKTVDRWLYSIVCHVTKSRTIARAPIAWPIDSWWLSMADCLGHLWQSQIWRTLSSGNFGCYLSSGAPEYQCCGELTIHTSYLPLCIPLAYHSYLRRSWRGQETNLKSARGSYEALGESYLHVVSPLPGFS